MKPSKFLLLFIAGLFPFMTLFVSGFSIYLVNRNEIIFTPWDIILPIALLFIVLTLLLWLLLWSVRNRGRAASLISGLLLGISVAVWIQSQLLVWNFGQFNGQVIPWGQWTVTMIVEGAIWLIVIAGGIAGFVKSRPEIRKTYITIAYLLGIASLIISFLNAPERSQKIVWDEDNRDIFTFNQKNNVLIILLDAFESDYFGLIAQKYPSDITELDGFTFYRNTISQYPTTKASLPNILTGGVYKNKHPFYDFYQVMYDRFNIIRPYAERSYSTYFLGHLAGSFPDFISMERATYKLSNNASRPILEYLDYTFFRALPTSLKPLVYNDGNWFFTLHFRKKYPPLQHGVDIQFLELLEKNANLSSTRNGSFKFFHFSVPHFPCYVDENLKFNPNLRGESGYISQARGALKIASRILALLKRLGIYDRSEIIILSDHGSVIHKPIDRGTIYDDALDMVSPLVQSSSLALLLHKPSGSKGSLTISDAPLELSDLGCLLGIQKNDTVCRDFQTAISGGTRQRMFYHYAWGHEYWDSFYLPPITEYIVTGDAWRRGSFAPGKFIYTEKGAQPIKKTPTPISYELGKEILCFTEGNHEQNPYALTGWSNPELYQQWTEGSMASLSFRLEEAPRKDLVFRLQGFGYLGNGKIPYQVVTVVVNSVPLAKWMVNEEKKWYEVTVPADIIKDTRVNIVLSISNPMSPSASGDSDDTRKLGIGVCRIILAEKR